MATIKLIKMMLDKEAWTYKGPRGIGRLVHKDGTWFFSDVHCVRVRNPDGSTMTESYLGFPFRCIFSRSLEKMLVK